MAEVSTFEDILERIRAMGADERKRMLQDMELAVAFADKVEGLEDVPENLRGTPKDTAVQRLAGIALRIYREPAFRTTLLRRFGPEEVISYRKIGDLIGVTYERVRELHAQLEPESYELQRQDRRVS